jgi:hypothetical protein
MSAGSATNSELYGNHFRCQVNALQPNAYPPLHVAISVQLLTQQLSAAAIFQEQCTTTN